ncbi:GT4 family glycosyltransferase PelF [Pelagibacterium sp.]|uniref:GT4 family glycosyltransferase PelF n=1 Tax=Pelagibacterium sp. TaxID=1967288 RepID=UPI003A8EDE4B
MEVPNWFAPAGRRFEPEADVCLIAEGCYPYVSGGVSNWIDWLIRTHPELTFSVLAILPSAPQTEPRYERPDNLKAIHHLLLDDKGKGQRRAWPAMTPQWYADTLTAILDRGDAQGFQALLEKLGPESRRPSVSTLLDSRQAWQALSSGYARMPQTAFISYFWAWRALAGGLLRTLVSPLPSARLYHSVSTGYAGLVAARAAHDTGRPVMITEHGIYSNERRVEILMADWIKNSIDTGLDFADERHDVRDFWADAFESFARIAYSAADDVIALYGDNNAFQQALGADSRKLTVVPNGVDVDRFETLPMRQSTRPTLAFIGRVTPIKDVQTFIDVAERAASKVPGLRALIIGPMDEDPDYAQSCVDAVKERGLGDIITFTGPVDVRDYMAEIDVLMLTSISEALPLVILEAGASGVPCIATDVGACREILGCPGSPGQAAVAGVGGIVAPVGDVGSLVSAAVHILTNPMARERMGSSLREKVRTQYRSDTIASAYTRLYGRHLSQIAKSEV